MMHKAFFLPESPANPDSLPFGREHPWLAPLAGYSDLPFRLLCRQFFSGFLTLFHIRRDIFQTSFQLLAALSDGVDLLLQDFNLAFQLLTAQTRPGRRFLRLIQTSVQLL